MWQKQLMWSLLQTEKKRPLNCGLGLSHLYTLQTLADDLPFLQFYQPFWMHECYLPGGGTCQNFDRDARPIFWVWNFAKSYFSGLANFLAIFLGFANFRYFFVSDKFPAIFGGLPIFVPHTWILCMKNTQHSTEKHKIIVAFHIYSNFDTLHLESFYFFGFEFWGILFFGGLNLESFYFLG